MTRKSTPASGADRVDVYQMVTDKVIDALEAGNVPWHQPWNAETGVPTSLSTRKPYRGINAFLLGLQAMVEGYTSPWWGTYGQIQKLGGQVRRTDKAAGIVGAKGTKVTFWKTIVTDEVDPRTGKKKVIPFLRSFTVFNSEQADWQEGKAPVVTKIERTEHERIAAAEAIIAGYANAPAMRVGSAAYYTPGTDVLTMPPLDTFDSLEEYYSTLFHEETHSTGHDSRLARPGVKSGDFGSFGDESYSKEELVAEMGAAMLSAIAGLQQTATLPNSAAYLRHWLGVLKADKKLLVSAAGQAQKAADHILGVTWDNDKTEEE